MTDPKNLPVSPATALVDIQWYGDNLPRTHEERAEIMRAARTLATVVERVSEMTASRIGADDFLGLHGDGVDTHSFYQGVSFALMRVNQILETGQVQR